MASTTTPSEGPTTLTKASASRKPGTVWNASVMRISASSTRPPKKPASVPTTVPTAIAVAAAASATASEVRAPCTMPASTSRPSRSVPSGSASPGTAAAAAAPAIDSGSRGKQGRGGERQRGERRSRISAPATPSRRAQEAAGRAHAGFAAADARVEQGVDHVDDEVDRDDQHGAGQDDAEQQRRVARGDGFLRQPAEAGTANTVSMTTLPPSIAADCRPSIVTTGSSALRATCASTMRRRDRPRALAARTKSMRQTSAMAGAHDAQIQRQIDEAERSDRQHQMAGDVERPRKAGLARGDGLDAGERQPAQLARQRPRSAPARARSRAPHRAPASRPTAAGREAAGLAPATMPSAEPRPKESAVALPISSKVFGSRSRITSRIGREKVTDQPRSRWASAQQIGGEPRQRRLVEPPALAQASIRPASPPVETI